MKKILLFCSIFLLGNSFVSAQLLTESFETDGEVSRYTSNPFQASCDFFLRDNNSVGCLTNNPTGLDGSYYWAGEDTDTGVDPTGVLTLNALAVTGFTLDVDVLLGIGRPNDFRFEPDDELLFQYNMDGGGWVTFAAFYGSNDGLPGSTGNLVQDTDLDGFYNSGAPEINSFAMQNWNFTIPTTGNSLQVRFIMGQDQGGGEEIMIDNIRINGNAATSPEIVITGLGFNILDGDVNPIATDNTDFENVTVSNSEIHTFTIDNTIGSGALNVTSITSTGINSSDFVIGGITLPATISAGSTATFTTTFTPSITGSRTAIITVNNNDIDEAAYDFVVQGTGNAGVTFPEIDIKGLGFSISDGDITPITTDNSDYGNVAVTSPSVHMFTIDNTNGTGALNVTSIATTGTNATDFIIGGIALPATVPAGNITTFTATFTPIVVGLRTATITVNNDDADESVYNYLVQGIGFISIPTCTNLLTESFETDGEGTRYLSNTFNNGCSDLWSRTTNISPSCPTTLPTNINGSFYWTGEDLDAASGGTGILTLDPLAVTGFDLYMEILLSIPRPNDGRFEPSDEMIFQYNFDGGGWNTFAAFYGSNDGNSATFGNLIQDTDLDGFYDLGAPQIGSTDFENFAFQIPASGNSLQVRIICGQDQGGGEEIRFDNIRICGAVPACTDPTVPTVTASPSSVCTGNTTTLTISGTLNDATDWYVYTGSCGGTFVGTTTGSSFTTAALSGNTTFHVRGEGGCVTPGTCGSVSVSVNGPDTDNDGTCDATDGDDDNDGVADGSDPSPLNPNICGDSDADGCDDCSVGTDDFGPMSDFLPNNDGTDTDSDGTCNTTDVDDDNDGVADGSDPSPLNPNICGDSDADGCDDCSVGTDDFGPLADNLPNNDGTDTDSDGICNLTDTDDDNDGVADGSDPDPTNPFICGDVDFDGCDDCGIGVDGFGPLSDSNPANDGTDTDSDGICDSGDTDDDNDGVADGSDPNSLNPDICGDANTDACDDCAVGTDGFGPLADNIGDNVPPTAACQNITIYLDGSGNASIVASDIDGGSSDNCSISSMSLSSTNFTCGNVGTNNVTLTVTDASSNSTTCGAIVTVMDTISPTAVCQNVTVYLDASGNASVSALDINNGSSDNCFLAAISVSPSSFNCSNVGLNSTTFTATDVNSNNSTCISVVTVMDTISPTAVCQNIDLYLDAAGNASIVASDIDNGSFDNCVGISLAASQTMFTCTNIGTNNVTLTATDASSNSATCIAVVTVIDTVTSVNNCNDILIWTGATDTDWNTTTNWNTNLIPTSADEVLIPSAGVTNFPLIIPAITLGDITVDAGASLTVNDGIVLDGTFTNNGTVTLLDGAFLDDYSNPGTASYIGDITVERFVSNGTGNNQRFISSAVDAPPVSEIGDDLSGPWGLGLPGTDGVAVTIDDCALQTTTPTSNYGNLFEFNETLIATCGLDGWVVRSAGNLANGAGYSAYLTSGSTFDLTGFPNTGDVNVAVTNSGAGAALNEGWNMVGNPYPSSISRDDIITANAADIQYYVASGPYQGSFAAYMPTSNIAIGQGFQMFTPANATLTFTDAMRRTSNSTWYNTGAWFEHKLEVSVFGNNGADKTILFYNNDASSNYEAMYDVNKRDSDLGNPTLSTFSANKNLALNGLNITNLGETVPMNLKAGTDGNFSLKFEGLETFGNTTIYVKDLQENVVHNIANGDYAFTSTTSDNEGRFEIIFVPEVNFTATKVDCDMNDANLTLVNLDYVANRTFELLANNVVVNTGNLADLNTVELEEGNYTLNVADQFGGSQNYDVVIESAEMIEANLTVSNTEVFVGEMISLNNTTTNSDAVVWNLSNSTIGTVNNLTYTFDEAGTYEIEMMVSNNECSDAKVVTVEVASKTTAIETVNGSVINLYPNPATNVLNIETDVDVVVEMISILGKTIVRTSDKQISLENVTAGVYFIKIYDTKNKLIGTEKVIRK